MDMCADFGLLLADLVSSSDHAKMRRREVARCLVFVLYNILPFYAIPCYDRRVGIGLPYDTDFLLFGPMSDEPDAVVRSFKLAAVHVTRGHMASLTAISCAGRRR